MLHDARELDDAGTIECDLCIVGGGAGITLARSFVGGALEVCLLESGGLEFEDDIQALYQGQNVGLPYFDLDVCRLRFFGGSTNHWAGRWRPLDELDFATRPWVPLSGWPITKATLDPYYRHAQELCQLGAYDYAPEAWLGRGQQVLPFDPAKLVSRVWQFSPPTVFGEVYRAELESAVNVRVLLHASVVDISAGKTGAEVLHVEFATLAGSRGSVRARAYVLACGGLENPRLLLVAGLGNRHDMVGRYFMEHPHPHPVRALVTDPAALEFYTRGLGNRAGAGPGVLGCLSQSPEPQEALEVLNFDALFTADNIGDSGYAALRRIWNAAERGAWPEDLAGDLWQALIDIDDTAAGLDGTFRYPRLSRRQRELLDVVRPPSRRPTIATLLEDMIKDRFAGRASARLPLQELATAPAAPRILQAIPTANCVFS